MSSLLHALHNIDAHRDVVPLYYDRRARKFVVAQITRHNGGAFVLDEDGREVAFHNTKRAALASLAA